MLRLVSILGFVGSLLLASAASGNDRLNVVVVLDDSGSMAEFMGSSPRIRKIDAAKRALSAVMDQLPDESRVGVYALNSQGRGGQGHWIIPLGRLDRARTQRAIDEIRASGGTPLGASMKRAADALLNAREKQFYGDYRLLIVTDGEAQDDDLVDRYLPEIMNRQVTVDVIGVAMAQRHSLATRVDRYRRADDPASLQVAIKESLAETQPDPQDPDESAAFELLEGFPVEAALVAIEALSQTDNRPIGEGPYVSEETVAFHPSPDGRRTSAPAGRAPSGRSATSLGEMVRKVLGFAAFFFIVFVFGFMYLVGRILGRKRSR